MALPDLSQYMDAAQDTPANAPPQPTGTGNWLTAGLGSGFHQALSEAGSAGEAVGRAIGADSFANNAKAFADAQRQTAATYARPDLENAPLLDPTALAYRVTQGLPTMAGALVGGAAATALAPESAIAGGIGAGLAMLPGAIGGNVQRREDYSGDLDQGGAIKSIALGIPEAAAQGIMPAIAEARLIKGGIGRGLVGTVAKAAGIQAGAAGATEWLTQQMGDPNRTFADKAQDIVSSALSGGVLGGVTAGILHPLSPQHAIAKTPAGVVSTEDLLNASQVPTPQQPAPPVVSPGDDIQNRLQQRIAMLGRAVQGPGMPPAPEPVAPAPPVFGRGQNGLEGAPPEAPFTPLVPTRVGPGIEAPTGAPLPTPTETPPPSFDWEAQRKALQQGKAFSPIIKGPFASQDELNNTVAENLFNRMADGKTPPSRLLAAGKMLGIVDEKGQPTPAFAQKAADIATAKSAPPNIAPDAAVEPDQAGPTGAYTPPDRLEKAAIDLKHQGRWDALEAVRNRLLGDNLSDPDVQSMLSQSAELQNRLLKPGRGGTAQIEAATKSLQTQMDAKDAQAGPVQPSAPVDPRSPAVGPDPSPAAAAVIAKVTPDAGPTATKEAVAKAKRKGKPVVQEQPVAPEPTAEPTPAAPATMRDKTAQDAVAAGEAPPGVTPEDISAQKPNAAFPGAEAGLPPREQAIERDGRIWDYRQTSYPEDIEARAQMAEDQAKQAGAVQEGLRNFASDITNDAPLTKEQRAKAARQAMIDNRAPVDVAARGDIENQRTPEAVKPKLKASVDDVQDVTPQKELDPNNPADAKIIARQQSNETLPPAVDPSTLAGFARDGRKAQADARRERLNDDLRARLALVESGRRPVVPVPQKVAAMLQNGRDALTRLEQSGAIIPRHEDFAGKYERFQQLITQHREQMDLAERAARLGGMEGLREIPRDYFGTDLYDEMSGHVTPQTEQNLEQHATAESQLQDAAAMARGERPLVSYSMPPTQHDVDLKAIIDGTGKMKDVLAHIRANGTSVQAREMAHILDRGGAGGTISMSDRAPTIGRELKEGEYIAGMHYVDNNHTDIHDGSSLEQTVLHEATHAATERALLAGGPASQEMHNLFERVKSLNGGSDVYGLENTSEFVAEAMSNPTFQQFLKSQNFERGIGSRVGDMWNGFKNAVFKMLGMPNRVRSLFDQVMDGTNRLMGENVAEASRNVNNLVRTGGQLFSEASTQVGNALVKQYERALDDRFTSVKTGWRNHLLGWMTGSHLATLLAPHVPEVQTFMGLQNHRGIRTDILSKHEVQALEHMQALPKNGRDSLNRIEQSSVQNVDGLRAWKDNTWLKGDPQEAELQQVHAQLQREFNVLRNTPGGMEAYHQAVDANDVSRHLRDLHLMYDMYAREWGDEQWSGYDTDPIRDYEANDQLHDNALMAKGELAQRKAQMIGGMAAKATQLETLINSLKVKEQAATSGTLKPPLTPEQAVELRNQIKTQEANREAMQGLVSSIQNMDERAKQGPYFHLGRNGDHFVSAHVITNNNIPDDAALQKIKEVMDAKGFGDHVISRGVANSSIYVRMEGEQQRGELFRIFKELQAQGIIDPSKDVARGMAHNSDIYQTIGPQWMRQAIEAVRAQQPEIPVGASQKMVDSIKNAHDQQIREMTRSLMDMLPDTSITKLYAKRMNVQGFNANMINSYKAGAIASARGLSNMSLARELGLSAVKMTKQMEALNKSSAIGENRLTATAQGLGELVMRNKLYQAHVPSTFMDGIRKMVHTFQIGASPAYALTLMSQIPTLTLPELAKTHGYVRSAQALGKSATMTFKVMSAILNGPDKLSFGMRRETLEKAGIDKDTVDFLMNLAGRGAFNHGAFTEAITGHDTDTVRGKVSAYANMLGRYSEQLPRVLTALAARELHTSQPGKAGGMDVHQFAFDKVIGSQFNWNQELNARQTTRSGMFGAMSPMVNQFMGFQIRMTEKLYREVAGAFKGDKQAQVWLAGHAAAVTMLAGTLGLPMVSVAASVYDRLADWITDSDDHDVTASYRNFLAQSLGKEFGEAVARGAPRLAGMDFDHLGEGKIVPGSSMLTFMTEKRKLEDAEKDWLKNMAGSSMGFMFNVAAGTRDILNGDVMDAFVKTMPEILKGPMEAYRLSERGFVDKNGSKLPITASAGDVMMQALGIDPAKEAEYDEEKKVATGLQTLRQLRSQNITRHLLLATNRQDPGMMQTWQREAMKFGMDHPGMGNPMMDFERALTMHARNAAVAGGMGTPIGVQPRDLVGRGMTSFGNLRQGNQ